MPLSEYLSWLEYFSRTQDMADGKHDLADMEPDEIARAFGATVS